MPGHSGFGLALESNFSSLQTLSQPQVQASPSLSRTLQQITAKRSHTQRKTHSFVLVILGMTECRDIRHRLVLKMALLNIYTLFDTFTALKMQYYGFSQLLRARLKLQKLNKVRGR